MALSKCDAFVDSTGRELVSHGSREYPISCCHDNLGESEVPWHWHEEFEAVMVSEGAAEIAAGEQRLTVRAGEGFFVNSGVLHGCWDHENSSCRFHSLVFSDRLIGGASDSIYYEKYVRPLMEDRGLPFVLLKKDVHWQREALELIERAWQVNRSESPFYEIESRSCLTRFAALIRLNCRPSGTRPAEKNLRQGERMKAMLSFIQENFDEKISVRDIAASASISESECLRCFRDSINTTPISYLLSFRIQQAASMLTATDEKISFVAQQCGFDDMSYFTKLFRRIKGQTPSEYRRGDP